MRAYHYLTILASLLVVTGCGMEGPAPSDQKAQTPAAPTATASPATASAPTAAPARPTAEAPLVAAADAKPTAAAAVETKASAAAAANPKPSGTLKEAQVGMGAKGRGYGGGLIGVSVTSLWATRERVALMNMQHTKELYKGEHGYYPKTEAEFFQKIIKEGDIRLPQLPEGQKYEYDPETAELMVRMPAADAPNGP